MKLYVEKFLGKWRATAQQGHQYFQIGPKCETKSESVFFKKMFRIALRKHDAEKLNKKTKKSTAIKLRERQGDF